MQILHHCFKRKLETADLMPASQSENHALYNIIIQ